MALTATHADAILDALLGADGFESEREELAAGGVVASVIDSLYPRNMSNFPAGLKAYLARGGRVNLNLDFETDYELKEAARVLRSQSTWSQLAAMTDYFKREQIVELEEALVAHGGSLFATVSQLTGSHETQASNLLLRLRPALWWAYEFDASEQAVEYLTNVVKHHLPDLVEGGVMPRERESFRSRFQRWVGRTEAKAQ